ncbi:pro-sigmaK processing inhibitor BofA family protein [Candidatus Stoquefichus massiliensis]|uniref:pro-sigmaK processing inhibitor BofA family protein n=1 Tax=Candidatus Stoquefichus massiliensis TaxID=1470350 RepID=UPI0021C2EF26|nr:pro-sigmaK processing inhibitor BofA family protein [Candidatus Stoquefichus massiliensis]
MIKRITRVFIRLLFATLFIFVFNSFESITHITLTLNIFNIIMISLFDIFGVILCIVLKFIL